MSSRRSGGCVVAAIQICAHSIGGGEWRAFKSRLHLFVVSCHLKIWLACCYWTIAHLEQTHKQLDHDDHCNFECKDGRNEDKDQDENWYRDAEDKVQVDSRRRRLKLFLCTLLIHSLGLLIWRQIKHKLWLTLSASFKKFVTRFKWNDYQKQRKLLLFERENKQQTKVMMMMMIV